MNTKKFFQTVLVLGLFTIGTVSASAWNAPLKGSARTIGNIPAELINTGCKYNSDGSCTNRQGKYGPFITESFLKAGNNFAWSMPGTIVAENFIQSSNGNTTAYEQANAYFKKMFMAGTQGQLVFGISRSTISGADTAPVVGKFNGGKDKVNLLADSQFCNTQTMITTDTPAIQFWSTNAGTNAVVAARGVQLSGGNPQPGMILISTDTQGNAVWATPVLNADGTITFTHGASPVVAGQASCD